MRPCLNPGQMNPPGGMHSPAAWITPPLPPLPHSDPSVVCAPAYSPLLPPMSPPFTSPTESPLWLHSASCGVAHIICSFCSNAWSVSCTSDRLVTSVFKQRYRLEADLWPGHHYSVQYRENFITHLLYCIRVCVCVRTSDGPIPRVLTVLTHKDWCW